MSDRATGPAAFIALLAAYVALGVFVRSVVLNWIVGPLFPVLFLYVVPNALARLRRSSPKT